MLNRISIGATLLGGIAGGAEEYDGGGRDLELIVNVERSRKAECSRRLDVDALIWFSTAFGSLSHLLSWYTVALKGSV